VDDGRRDKHTCIDNDNAANTARLTGTQALQTALNAPDREAGRALTGAAAIKSATPGRPTYHPRAAQAGPEPTARQTRQVVAWCKAHVSTDGAPKRPRDTRWQPRCAELRHRGQPIARRADAPCRPSQAGHPTVVLIGSRRAPPAAARDTPVFTALAPCSLRARRSSRANDNDRHWWHTLLCTRTYGDDRRRNRLASGRTATNRAGIGAARCPRHQPPAEPCGPLPAKSR